MKLLRTLLTALLLTLPFTPAAQAAVSVVLRLDGIPGESQVPGHFNEIDIADISFSVQQSLLLKEAGKSGAAAGKAAFTPLMIRKGADTASAALFMKCILGTPPIKSAKITFLAQQDGPTATEFFSITLGGVFVSKFEVAGASGDENTSESITLNYSTIFITYTPRTGAPVSFGFDVIKNKPFAPPVEPS